MKKSSFFEFIDINDSKRWNQIVASFQQYDVYYLSNYVKAFRIHGDGDPYLIYYETELLRGINVVMLRDISLFYPLKDLIPSGTYYDIVTPYGYGGFIFEGNLSDSSLNLFYVRYSDYIKSKNIVTEFVRYHPQIKNANAMRSVSNLTDRGKTISIDLESADHIWTNFSSNNRNNIRRGQKSGVEILHGKSSHLLDDFMRIYNATMNKDEAESYYYFEKAFYESIHLDLFDHYEMFYAVLDEKIIGIAIMIFANNRMHCHLCGSLYDYRYVAPTNMIFYEAACWGIKQGFKTMHLGGGVGAEEDDLFRFKKSFNRLSDNTFSVGKEIFNTEMYNRLVEYRKEKDVAFNANSAFFPLYRA